MNNNFIPNDVSLNNFFNFNQPSVVQFLHRNTAYLIFFLSIYIGFEIFKEAASDKVDETHRYDLDLHEIAEVWRHGSVVSSWLLDLLEIALRDDQALSDFSGHVGDSGEGRWTIQTAIEEDVPAHVLTASLFTRFQSRQDSNYAGKVLSALRHQFGGHVEKK